MSDGREHAVTDDNVAAGARSGRYRPMRTRGVSARFCVPSWVIRNRIRGSSSASSVPSSPPAVPPSPDDTKPRYRWHPPVGDAAAPSLGHPDKYTADPVPALVLVVLLAAAATLARACSSARCTAGVCPGLALGSLAGVVWSRVVVLVRAPARRPTPRSR